jgi:hypothetical protein
MNTTFALLWLRVKLRPGGSCPAITLHVLIAEDPWAVMDVEYGAFVCAGAGVTGLITSLSNTSKKNCWLALAFASAALIVTVLTTAMLVGVPEIVPVVLFRAKPSGNCPVVTDHVTALLAPVSCRVSVKGNVRAHITVGFVAIVITSAGGGVGVGGGGVELPPPHPAIHASVSPVPTECHQLDLNLTPALPFAKAPATAGTRMDISALPCVPLRPQTGRIAAEFGSE